MTYEFSKDTIDDPLGKGAYYIGTGGLDAYNTALAAAMYMLDLGIELFSKKERDDGTWWVMLDRPTMAEPIWNSGPIPATQRVRGEGNNLAEAVEDCFEKMGCGGLKWKLYKLERRVIQLALVMGFPPIETKAKKGAKKELCAHGVWKQGARCKKCGT